MNNDKKQVLYQNLYTHFAKLDTIKQAIDWAKQLIADSPDLSHQSPDLEVNILFEHATTKNKAWQMAYAANMISCLSTTQIHDFVQSVAQRISGKPIAFIIGNQEFWSMKLKVLPCTLIPRQDTETLVENALQLPLDSTANVLDLGTGTGAIALALKKERPKWQITGTDFVPEAVQLAQDNAKLHNLPVRFIQSDWFSAFDSINNTKQAHVAFDLIVSNPPYIEESSEYVRQGDLRFEPLTALTSGEDGLVDLQHIILNARKYLKPNGYLLLEHGFNQSEVIKSMLCEQGFTNVKSKNDLNNIPRITMGKWRSANCVNETTYPLEK